MTTFDAGFPPHALRVWADRSRVYVSYPSAAGNGPFVVAYDNNTDGLRTIIASMVKAYEEAHPLPRALPSVSAPTKIAVSGQRRDYRRKELTADEREAALAALRAVGLLPQTTH